MTTTVLRRWRNTWVAALAAGAIVLAGHVYDISLRDASFYDGWMLFAGMVFLTLLNARKKIPMVPLFTATAWLQAHVYVGAICVVLFMVHSKLRWPDGGFEITLWVVFVLVVLSGVFGLLLSRALPQRVSGGRERLIFERLPGFRAQLADRAQELAIESVSVSGTSTIADFYVARLAAYFRRPRHVWSHLMRRDAPLRRLRNQVAELKRYQDSRGQEILSELDELIQAKDNLDHQYAVQFTLKAWLFVHIPLAYSALILSVAHVLLAYAFASGSP